MTAINAMETINSTSPFKATFSRTKYRPTKERSITNPPNSVIKATIKNVQLSLNDFKDIISEYPGFLRVRGDETNSIAFFDNSMNAMKAKVSDGIYYYYYY